MFGDVVIASAVLGSIGIVAGLIVYLLVRGRRK